MARGIGSTLAEAVGRLGYDDSSGLLGDFTTTRSVVPLTGLAVVIGVLSAFVALVLLRLIGLFTNLFFYQRIGEARICWAAHGLLH
jgi:CIC family chloride channel protein